MRYLAWLALLPAALAADASKPHMNKGVATPFATTKQDIKLSASDEAVLAAGKPVMRQTIGADGKGVAMAIQDVAATPETVWDRLFAFKDYPSMVNGCKECEVYEDKRSGDLRTVKVRMKIGMMGVSLEYFIDHTFSERNQVMTWTLDYSRLSDLIDSVGYWATVPHPTKPGHTRLMYSVDTQMPSWVPGFVVTAITAKALTDATAWVKVESEKLQQKRGGLPEADGAAAPSTKKACKAAGGAWVQKQVCDLPAAAEGSTGASARTRPLLEPFTMALLLVASFAAGIAFGRDTAPSAKPARQW
jgi:ribosome-associated toxin RatA of RatAB toxin-antitoxin module